jgi:hypothetical protein
MSHQIPHPTFVHNIYTCPQMSQDVYTHLPSRRMTLQQLGETQGVTTLSKQNDKSYEIRIFTEMWKDRA